MSDYQNVIDEMRAVKTVAAHVTALGKIMNKTHDSVLQKLLATIIHSLQNDLTSAKKGKTVPMAINSSRDPDFIYILKYCNSAVGTQKPAWMIEAERNGWGPLPK